MALVLELTLGLQLGKVFRAEPAHFESDELVGIIHSKVIERHAGRDQNIDNPRTALGQRVAVRPDATAQPFFAERFTNIDWFVVFEPDVNSRVGRCSASTDGARTLP